MILWTLVLVTVIGGVIGMMCFQPPAPESAQLVSPAFARLQRAKARKVARLQAAPISLDERRPASLHATAQGTVPLIALSTGDSGSSIDLALGCSDATHSQLEYEIAQVRLTGKLCAPHEEIVSTEVRNTSNGGSATIFYPSERAFTTDYMALSVGENKVRILHTLKNGGREEHEYVFDRKARAAVAD
jgi:hypothetical protein